MKHTSARAASLTTVLGQFASFAASLVVALSARGSPPIFTERVISTNAINATSVFAIDMDGDGDIDVLSASIGDAKVAWYENDGGSPPIFTERLIRMFETGARSVYATDLDGDGDIDVLCAATSRLVWYESDGSSPPNFTEHTISTFSLFRHSVFATDVNGDGDIDVLATLTSEDKIAWYQNNGGSPPSFTEHVISSNIDSPKSIFATDLDGDGDTDVLSASVSDHTLAWYENEGGLVPSFTRRVISTNLHHSWYVFATDLNGDGNIDVLSGSSMTDKIGWYENEPNVTGPPNFIERRISTTSIGANSLFAIDMDGDGDTDVLSAFFNDSKIAWYESSGGSLPTFAEHVITSNADNAFSVFATDLDGDGDTDVLSASADDAKIAWHENTPAPCGNGVVDDGEQCDDGANNGTGNGYCLSCCTGVQMCGDGVTNGTEECDGGNTEEGDGCSATCAVEEGWTCTGEPTICTCCTEACGTAAVEVAAPDSLSHADPPKNRVLSIVPGNEGRQTALRVTLTFSSIFPSDVGKQWWVGTPREICENSGQGITVAPGDCGPAPGIPKKTLWSSELKCRPDCHDWHSIIDFAGIPLDVLHIRDPDIVAGSAYEIQVIDCQCDPSISNNYSTALPVATSQWGDTTRSLPSDCPRQPPDGSVDLILDCVAILEKFTNSSCAMLKSRADVEPHEPDLMINITDVLECVLAFSGASYPYPAPVGCP